MLRLNWTRKRLGLVGLVLLMVLAEWKCFRGSEQIFAHDLDRFNYGSLGAELLAGIPYPIFAVLPQVFPDLLEHHATQGFGPQKAKPANYSAFGLAWEPAHPLPVGFSIKQSGYDRVTINCALCHTTVYRLQADDAPRFAFGGAGHSADLQGLFRFLFAAARDPRFTADTLLPVITEKFPLGWFDRVFYTAVLIPATRLGLKIAEGQLGWMNSKPAWGPGRDDAFNLPKYVLTQAPWDDTVGNTDFPALWRLGERTGQLIHVSGEARSVATVVASSALGTGSPPFGDFEERNLWLEKFLSELAPPPFPGVRNAVQGARGASVFKTHCAGCHANTGVRTGTAIPVAEIGTDPERVQTWQPQHAERMNKVTGTLGMRNAELQGAQGYVARPLVGVWLLAPYLHNGSVPTLHDLLTPPAQRPQIFFRGYDVIDVDKVGFIATGPEAEAHGFRFDTQQRGNSNAGHNYGTALPDLDKRALLEYLKTI